MEWNTNYSVAILLFGVFICVAGVAVYLFFSHRKNSINQKSYFKAYNPQSKDFLGYTFEENLNPIIIVKNEDLKVVKCNKIALEWFGGNILEANFLDLFSVDTQREEISQCIDKVRGSKKQLSLKIDLDIRDGFCHAIMLNVQLFILAKNSIFYFTFIDISKIAKIKK